MLDSVTKKRIDDLRNILVGKIPSPQSQVEQVTTGLIYKFMYDMDVEAVEMGGVPSFFVDDYEKYSWKHLFDPKLGGADKVQLYSDAIENMYTNPSAPQLFREIFKNSFLPFKDPSTLNMFLKEINEFHYSHSEKLGDAFEYLLSFMGSQGDAGQFRTPRHIIDFIVEIVNPQKNETILDPACGTAGFLISSYKHILSQNTDKKLGDKLNASDRKQVGDNLVGYDISPDMTRISLVNMYLHQFASPQIHEYDTLSSEDRWNEYYDVILANPPFFSPTGGIQPHSRFGVQSTRAEVLFVDYIMEHLKPTGRAGIVVPEGIIFQTGNAYKTLRKKLVEDCLVGVISLPAGVFQPYSGVKTSILILDKELNQKSDSIFFAKVENDGFSLGAQRKLIGKNDLPNILECIGNLNSENENFITATKEEISDKSYGLSYGLYLSSSETLSDYEYIALGNIFEEIKNGRNVSQQDEVGRHRVSRIQSISDGTFNKEKTKWTNDELKDSDFLKSNDILFSHINSIEHVGKTALFNEQESIVHGANLLRFRTANPKIDPNFALSIFKSEKFLTTVRSLANQAVNQASINTKTLKEIEIPLPPIEVQQQIVDELEGYQKIIDGCRQVVENYKPTIDIDPSWELVEIGAICSLKTGGTPKSTKKEYYENGTIPWLVSGDIHTQEIFDCDGRITKEGLDSSSAKLLPIHSVLIALNGQGKTRGTVAILRFEASCNQSLVSILPNDKEVLLVEYLFVCLSGMYKTIRNLTGDNQRSGLNMPIIKEIKIPIAPISVQKEIVQKIEEERKIIEGNKKLIEIYNKKIQDRISRVWGE